MKLILILWHDELGKAYVYGNEFMTYHIGNAVSTHMKFEGYTLEEVLAKAFEKGFKVKES